MRSTSAQEEEMEHVSKVQEAQRAVEAQVIALLQEGKLAYEAVARKCGCTVSTVYHIARREGLRRKDVAARGGDNGQA